MKTCVESAGEDMKPPGRSVLWFWLAGICIFAAGHSTSAAPHRARAAPKRNKRNVVVVRAMPASNAESGAAKAVELRLLRDQEGNGFLVRFDAGGKLTELVCSPLEGAWGLWIEDVDGDSQPDAVIALRKRARFDPVLENRLHVYALVGDRCVPLWRGTRLAGRFDAVNPVGAKLLALERIGNGRRRVARYGWTGFGYVLEETLWIGAGNPPEPLRRALNR